MHLLKGISHRLFAGKVELPSARKLTVNKYFSHNYNLPLPDKNSWFVFHQIHHFEKGRALLALWDTIN